MRKLRASARSLGFAKRTQRKRNMEIHSMFALVFIICEFLFKFFFLSLVRFHMHTQKREGERKEDDDETYIYVLQKVKFITR